MEKQLAGLSAGQREGQDGLALQNRAQTLRLLAGLNAGTVQIAQEAVPPTSPSSPKTSRNTALGLLLGLVIGFGIALLLEQLDRRLRVPEELEALYEVPLLGVVPASAALSTRELERNAVGADLVPAEAETFNLIRAHLRFFNVDRQLRTLMVVSPEPQDGKSTVALSIAESAARAGSRVLLIEADLRQPTLAPTLSLTHGPGLTDVLIGAAALLEDASQQVALVPAARGRGTERTLDVFGCRCHDPAKPSRAP